MLSANPAVDIDSAPCRNPLTLSECKLFAATSLLGLILVLLMPVFAQEAYYWTYAQHPGLSYFDHPPMVAWSIWLGTRLAGDGVLGLRLGTWLCSVGSAWFGMLLLRDFGARTGGIRAWLLLTAGVPILASTKFLASPDASLVFFWTLCLWALWRARTGALAWWLFAGAAAGGALLSKYTAIFLAVGGVLVLLLDPMFRRQLRRPGPWLGVGVAALVFQPVFLWNLEHHFASFRFQTETRAQNAQFGVKWLLELVLQQIGVLNPFVAVAFAGALPWVVRRVPRNPALLYVLAFGLPLPLFLLLDSLWVQVKINWLIPAYVPLLLGGCLWWEERSPAFPRWRRLTLALGVSVVACGLTCAWVVRFVPQTAGSSWEGWEEIASCAERWEECIDLEDGEEGNLFFFAGDYRDASQLDRELVAMVARRPGGHHLEDVMSAQNVLGRPALMYDYWFDALQHVGQDAVFVLPRPSMRRQLLDDVEHRFAKVERVETVAVERLGRRVMDADIFVCRHYLGPESSRHR
ncbi:MAG TPA: glycosyltransferase family 39 protein [Planctomycetota bacterium]|nr:glycosyltransferase family 39 protein [Planctomycetota bacterium]